jgi:hypothetical protein
VRKAASNGWVDQAKGGFKGGNDVPASYANSSVWRVAPCIQGPRFPLTLVKHFA